MKIREYRKPNLIADPDVVIVDEVPDEAMSNDVRKFVAEQIDLSSYFHVIIELYAGETTAYVKLYKD